MKRIEKDSIGNLEVPQDKYYGAQTARSLINFPISNEKFTPPMIRALGVVKLCAAQTNFELGLLDKEKYTAITHAAKEVTEGLWNEHFPLSIWQTGSGTQSNMNCNEVISNRAIELMGGKIGTKKPVHPNDHVNMSQSSNDTFPTAMHIATIEQINTKLLPVCKELQKSFSKKSSDFNHIIKIGRTHLQDATPLSLGQEFSAYAFSLSQAIKNIKISMTNVYALAQGGTAVGTGLNSKKQFAEKFAQKVSQFTGYEFITAPNKFESLATHDALVTCHNAISALAISLNKIANDLRLLASGPRSGLGEITLPANEPGSSIMPGKVNPTQCEAISMISIQIIGNNNIIAMAGAHGHLQLNVYKPLIIHNVLQSIRLLSDGIKSFNEKCVINITANEEKISQLMQQSLMLVTALAPKIGYDNAAMIAKTAHKNNTTLKEEAVKTGLVSLQEYDELVDPSKMISPSD